jgi:glycosyltransferase involved in cell wall biosynthesis
VPEILEHGVTGYICHFEDEMVDAIGRLGNLDRARCRLTAEQRFSPDAMASAYERVYTRLILGAAHPPLAAEPHALSAD